MTELHQVACDHAGCDVKGPPQTDARLAVPDGWLIVRPPFRSRQLERHFCPKHHPDADEIPKDWRTTKPWAEPCPF